MIQSHDDNIDTNKVKKKLSQVMKCNLLILSQID